VKPGFWQKPGFIQVNIMHNIKRIWLTLATGLGLAACAPAPMTPPIKPNTPLPVAWQTRVGDSLNEIALHDGMAFVVNENNRLIALDAGTGKKQWEASLNLVNTRGNAVGAEGGRVFALTGREDVSVVAFDAKTGNKLWEASTGKHKGTRYPAASGGRVFFDAPAADGSMEMRAVDAATGKSLWALPLEGSVDTDVIPANGLLYFGVGKWAGANKTAWRLVALDPATGDLRWEAQLEPSLGGRIAVDDKQVYVGYGSGQVQARNAATGEPAWTERAVSRLNLAPTATGAQVFAGSSDGAVVSLDPQNGATQWTSNAGSAVLTQVAVTDGVGYLGTNDGDLVAFEVGTGVERWRERSPERRPVVPGPYVPAMGTTPVVAGDLLLYFNGDALNALKLR
jgi:outer membrane protein assembly factor BamB